MNYSESLNYINNECTSGSVYGLERIKELLHRLSSPEKSLNIIHVAGTNGKGSVSRMLMNILYRSGYKVGIFNSPFLSRRNEYLCINGRDASDDEYAVIAGIVKNTVEGTRLSLKPMKQKPTEFEFSFAMAMEYFCRKKCDFAIVECGLGGKTDATNVFTEKVLSIITNIGLDHTALLGDSISKIARQKGGIIIQNDTVISYPSVPEAMKIINRVCKDKNAQLIKPDCIFYGPMAYYDLGTPEKYNIILEVPNLLDNLSLKGEFQKKNAMVAIASAIALKDKGYKISRKALSDGLSCTNWHGRFEILNKQPLVIADGGHNAQCAQALTESLDKEGIEKAIFIIGIMADKDYLTVFKTLTPYTAYLIATEPDNPRRLSAERITECFSSGNIGRAIVKNPEEAVKYALSIDKEKYNDKLPVIITGSLYMMGDILKYFSV